MIRCAAARATQTRDSEPLLAVKRKLESAKPIPDDFESIRQGLNAQIVKGVLWEVEEQPLQIHRQKRQKKSPKK